MIWEILEALASLVSAGAIIFMALDFRSERRREANVLTAIPVRGNGSYGILMQNSAGAPVSRVQIRICGKWDTRTNKTAIVLPVDRSANRRFIYWANVLPGQWYIDGNDQRKGVSKELYPRRYGVEQEDESPLYDENASTAFYVDELVYTDVHGHRWSRKSLETCRLSLGEAKPVKVNYNL